MGKAEVKEEKDKKPVEEVKKEVKKDELADGDFLEDDDDFEEFGAPIVAPKPPADAESKETKDWEDEEMDENFDQVLLAELKIVVQPIQLSLQPLKFEVKKPAAKVAVAMDTSDDSTVAVGSVITTSDVTSGASKAQTASSHVLPHSPDSKMSSKDTEKAAGKVPSYLRPTSASSAKQENRSRSPSTGKDKEEKKGPAPVKRTASKTRVVVVKKVSKKKSEDSRASVSPTSSAGSAPASGPATPRGTSPAPPKKSSSKKVIVRKVSSKKKSASAAGASTTSTSTSTSTSTATSTGSGSKKTVVKKVASKKSPSKKE